MLKYSDIPDAKKLEVKKYIGEIGSEHISRIVVEKVKEKFNVIIDERSVRYILQRIRESLDQVGETLEKAIEAANEGEEKPYEMLEKDGKLCYKLDAGKSIFIIPVEDIDKMFKDYSANGNNLSGEKMRQKYGLKPHAWQAIKSKLSLVKDSHVISPYTLENLSEAESDEMIERAIEEHIDTKIGKFVNTYDKQFKDRAIKALKVVSNFEHQLKLIEEAIVLYEKIDIDFVPKKIENNDMKMIAITDIHFGKIDTASVIKRMDAVYNKIVQSPERIIYISILGDLVETFLSDGFHPGQITYGTDSDFGVGVDAMLKIANIFEKFFIGLYKEGKEIHVRGISGNHGRLTPKRENDPENSGEIIVYELIKRALMNLEMDIQYFRKQPAVFDFVNINVIAHHGHVLGSKNPEKIILEHGKMDRYNIIMSGHTHAVEMREGNHYTAVVVPALAGVGDFDETHNLHSESGYMEVKENEYKTADITIKRLSK